MRVLAILTDAFGGYGGISVANRHFLRGLCAWDAVDEVVAVPMLMPHPPEALPEKLTYRTEATGSRARFATYVVETALRHGPFDAIWCGHLDLVTLASTIKGLLRTPLVLHMHGIDAWTPPDKSLRRFMLRSVDHFVSVSQVTKERFLEWAPLEAEQGHVLPNTVDFSPYAPGPKRPDLLDRYELGGRTVLMTMGRLVSRDRAKGFDEILQVLPDLARAHPDVTYLIAGKGPDKPRLEAKARALGVRNRVVFTGYVPEEEKADHYRLADLYVMPSHGEGFGLVLLEAMACGIPTVASTADGSREAVLDGTFGAVVDPDDPDALRETLLRHIDDPQPPDVDALRSHFGPVAYNERLRTTFSRILSAEDADFVRI